MADCKCSLPVLRKQLDNLLKECSEELNGLPPRLINEPSSELIVRIGKFSEAFRGIINAVDDKTLVRKARHRFEQYKADILATGPDFRPFVAHEEYMKPGLPQNEHEPVGRLGGPLDLTHVRKVIKKCVSFVFRRDILKSYLAPLDGN